MSQFLVVRVEYRGINNHSIQIGFCSLGVIWPVLRQLRRSANIGYDRKIGVDHPAE
jgi:hypothetical protein